MTNSPLFTIITITYNDPEGLRHTLSSLKPLAQSKLSWELVLVDGSPEKNQALLPNDWPLVLLREEPKGIYAAMNQGLSVARGKYVWFLNGGDALASLGALEAALASLEASPHVMMALGGAELRRHGKTLYTQKARGGLLPLLGINRICHQAILYRREVFQRLGPYQERYRLAADYEHHLRAHAAGLPVRLLPQTLALYDTSGQSADFTRALREFANIHAALKSQGLLSHAWLHWLALGWEWLRISALKAVKRSFAGPLLEPAWRAYQKKRN